MFERKNKPNKQKTRRVREGATAIFLMQRGGLWGGLHPWKIMLNYNHVLSIQIINKSFQTISDWGLDLGVGIHKKEEGASLLAVFWKYYLNYIQVIRYLWTFFSFIFIWNIYWITQCAFTIKCFLRWFLCSSKIKLTVILL